jgi:hypothetical protein
MTGNMVSALRGRWPWPVSRWEYSSSHCEAASIGGLFCLRLEWMRHRGVEFSVEQVSEREDVWIWRFKIAGEVRTGKTATKLRLMAIRRVQSAIDRELKKRNVP